VQNIVFGHVIFLRSPSRGEKRTRAKINKGRPMNQKGRKRLHLIK
jgi:hypothetical protein